MFCHKQKLSEKKNRGLLSGILYGIIPHIGCIGFIVFSVLGVTAATAAFRPLLLNPYFFHLLIALSLVFATLSAVFYLKRNGILSRKGIKRKKGYLFTLYGTTVAVNLILFMVIFPVVANMSEGSGFTASLWGALGRGEEAPLEEGMSRVSLKVDIPCPGHAPLISGELRTIEGVENISYRFPDYFDVTYMEEETSVSEIVSLAVFERYAAEVMEEKTSFMAESVEAAEEAPDIETQNKSSICLAGCVGKSGGCGCACGR